MTTNPEHFRRRDPAMGGEQYFDSAIRTASPARMRLMLIERAIEVSSRLSQTWRSDQAPGANEHSLQLLDLLTELLGGVVGGDTESEHEVCRKVSDLYVFLAKHLVAAEASSDANSIDEIRLVLEAEAETWRAVCAKKWPVPRYKPPADPPHRPAAEFASTPEGGRINFAASANSPAFAVKLPISRQSAILIASGSDRAVSAMELFAKG